MDARPSVDLQWRVPLDPPPAYTFGMHVAIDHERQTMAWRAGWEEGPFAHLHDLATGNELGRVVCAPLKITATASGFVLLDQGWRSRDGERLPLRVLVIARMGDAVEIVDDIAVDDEGRARLGRLAAYVRDTRVPLEMCPTSNVQTGAAASIAEHPIGLLRRLSFRVTVNTDNRLMSGTSMSREMSLLSEAFGYGLRDLQWFTVNAMKSAFLPFDERLALINDVIKPGYAAAAAELGDTSLTAAPPSTSGD